MWECAEDVLMHTVPVVDYRATQAIQAYTSIVHNETCIVHKFRHVWEAVCSTADGIEENCGEELCPQWPHVRVMEHVKVIGKDPASVQHSNQGDEVRPDIHTFIVDLKKAEQVVGPWLVDLPEPCFHVRLMKHPGQAGLCGGRDQGGVQFAEFHAVACGACVGVGSSRGADRGTRCHGCHSVACHGC